MSLKIALLATGTVGATGVAGGLAYWYSLPNNIKEALEKENLKPLSTVKDQDKQEWTKLAKKYSETNSEPKIGEFKITINGGGDPSEKDLENLQNKCQELFSIKKGNKTWNDSLNKAKAWCIKDSEKVKNS